MSIDKNIETVRNYMLTLEIQQKDKEEVSNVILGYMSDCQEKDQQITQLQTRNDKLMAQVERLREGLRLVIRNGELWEYKEEVCEYALDQTPTQSLNEIKARAIEEAANLQGEIFGGNELSGDALSFLFDYAKKLRESD